MTDTGAAASTATKEKSSPTKLSLDTVLREMENWRANKDKYPGKSIPNDLWGKIFSLSSDYPATTLKRVFSVNSKQFDIKKKELSPCDPKPESAPLKAQEPAGKKPEVAFSEVKVESAIYPQNVPPLTPAANTSTETLAKLRSNDSNLAKHLDYNTMILELVRPDGFRLKIHTTNKSLDEIMQSFCPAGGAIV